MITFKLLERVREKTLANDIYIRFESGFNVFEFRWDTQPRHFAIIKLTFEVVSDGCFENFLIEAALEEKARIFRECAIKIKR